MQGDIFDINIALTSERILVPDYRQAKQLAWLKALGTPLQEFHDKIFNDFSDGGTDWDGNAIIGIRERMRYNSQTMFLEWILNKHFGVTSAPFIYIQNGISVESEIFLTEDGDGYYPVFISESPNDVDTVYIGDVSDYSPENDFTVYVPSALYATLGASNPERTARVQKEVDKYKLIGINNNVATY